jgi:hypothetical protein
MAVRFRTAEASEACRQAGRRPTTRWEIADVVGRPERHELRKSEAAGPDADARSGGSGSDGVPYRLWIGVTGHRQIADVEGVTAAVHDVLRRVAARMPRAPRTPVRLGVISPLAEGADRLVARAVLENHDAVLEAPLPLPVDDYLRDFGTAGSREEFGALLGRAGNVLEMFPTDSREQAYKQVGEYVVDRCDVLIAVWDREHARGFGGTEDTYRYATGQGRRAVAVYVIDPVRAAVVEESVPEQGWPHGWAEVDRFNRRQISTTALTAELDRQRDQLLHLGTEAGLGSAELRAFLDWSLPCLVRADLLAATFRHRYMTVGNIVFGTTFAAVVVVAVQAIYRVPALSPVEFVLMAFLLATILWARRRRLHGNWLSYRSLAERFRTGLFSAIAGLGSGREATWEVREVDPSRPWDGRLFQEVWARRPRDAGHAPPAGLRAFLIKAWLDDQCRYHEKVMAKYWHRERTAQRLIYGIVGVALVAALLHVLPVTFPHLWEEFLLLVSAAAPALTMATAGIRERREYQQIGENSRRIRRYLLKLRPCLAAAPDLAAIQGFVQQLGRDMLAETKDWYSTMQSHDFEVQI